MDNHMFSDVCRKLNRPEKLAETKTTPPKVRNRPPTQTYHSLVTNQPQCCKYRLCIAHDWHFEELEGFSILEHFGKLLDSVPRFYISPVLRKL
eukprot:4725892-Amphidinium_carterae.1